MVVTTGYTVTPESLPELVSSVATSMANQIRLVPLPLKIRCIRELLATIYHGFGIDPETIVYNHLNQPRELVKAQAVTELFS